MIFDVYGDVVNGYNTYREIADLLVTGKRILIGWSDEDALHYDILFSMGAIRFGNMQGGIESTNLFVSIMRKGSFGFSVLNNDTHHNYYAEKLFLGSESEKVGELINGVKKQIVVLLSTT